MNVSFLLVLTRGSVSTVFGDICILRFVFAFAINQGHISSLWGFWLNVEFSLSIFLTLFKFQDLHGIDICPGQSAFSMILFIVLWFSFGSCFTENGRLKVSLTSCEPTSELKSYAVLSIWLLCSETAFQRTQQHHTICILLSCLKMFLFVLICCPDFFQVIRYRKLQQGKFLGRHLDIGIFQ